MSIWHAHSGLVVFHYPSRGKTDTRLCPYCYSCILGLSYSLHLTLSPRDPTPPPPPPLSSHNTGYSPLVSPIYPKRPDPLPTRSRALVLSPPLVAPPAPIGAGSACPVGDSEASLTDRLRRAPANALLDASNSAQLGSLSPEVSLPDCAAGSTCQLG